jgi:hypothetical protein
LGNDLAAPALLLRGLFFVMVMLAVVMVLSALPF